MERSRIYEGSRVYACTGYPGRPAAAPEPRAPGSGDLAPPLHSERPLGCRRPRPTAPPSPASPAAGFGSGPRGPRGSSASLPRWVRSLGLLCSRRGPPRPAPPRAAPRDAQDLSARLRAPRDADGRAVRAARASPHPACTPPPPPALAAHGGGRGRLAVGVTSRPRPLPVGSGPRWDFSPQPAPDCRRRSLCALRVRAPQTRTSRLGAGSVGRRFLGWAWQPRSTPGSRTGRTQSPPRLAAWDMMLLSPPGRARASRAYPSSRVSDGALALRPGLGLEFSPSWRHGEAACGPCPVLSTPSAPRSTATPWRGTPGCGLCAPHSPLTATLLFQVE